MNQVRTYLYVADLGRFFFREDGATLATNPVFIARINSQEIIAFRVLDFGQTAEETGEPDVRLYSRASLERIRFKNKPKSLSDARKALEETGEKSILFAYKAS